MPADTVDFLFALSAYEMHACTPLVIYLDDISDNAGDLAPLEPTKRYLRRSHASL